MRRILTLVAGMLLGAVATAQGVPPVAAPPFSMTLGDDFQTLFVTCGTPQHPECPRYLTPLGRPFRVHYVMLSGTTISAGSVSAIVKQLRPDGTETNPSLGRILIAANSDSSVVLTLPKPVLVGPDDAVGVVCPTVTTGCSVMATFGVELLR